MPNLEGLHTQISGKYSPDNVEIFAFRQRLVDLGVTVQFPAGDSILAYQEGFAITTPEEAVTPFQHTEEAFLDAIGFSDFHVVYNLWGDKEGYVGESTAIETIHAIAHNVPTVWLRPPGELSPHLSHHAAFFARDVMRDAWVEPLDQMSDQELTTTIGKLATQQIGIHPMNRQKPRPHFDGSCYLAPDGLGGPAYYYPLWDDYREELFVDIRLGLRDQYRTAWHNYQATASPTAAS